MPLSAPKENFAETSNCWAFHLAQVKMLRTTAIYNLAQKYCLFIVVLVWALPTTEFESARAKVPGSQGFDPQTIAF
jgi:hypothetical protein